MRISDEIDALEVMGLPSLRYLVSTRLIASIDHRAARCTSSASTCSCSPPSSPRRVFFGVAPGVYDQYFDAVPAPHRRALQRHQGPGLHRDRHLRPLRLRVPGQRRPRGRRATPSAGPCGCRSRSSSSCNFFMSPLFWGSRRHGAVLGMSSTRPPARPPPGGVGARRRPVAAWLERPGPAPMVFTAEFARAGLNVRPGDEVRVRGVPVGHHHVDRHRPRATSPPCYTLPSIRRRPIAAGTTAAARPQDALRRQVRGAQTAPGADEPAGGRRPTSPSTARRRRPRSKRCSTGPQPVLEAVDPVTLRPRSSRPSARVSTVPAPTSPH